VYQWKEVLYQIEHKFNKIKKSLKNNALLKFAVIMFNDFKMESLK